MNDFLTRIASRKFLTTLATQVASVVAIFRPAEDAGTIEDAAVRIAGLIVLLLASLGYGAMNNTEAKTKAEGSE